MIIAWSVFLSLVTVMIALDLGVFHRSAHQVTTKESVIWTCVWIGLALLFSGYIYFLKGSAGMVAYLTGYVVEKSLSIDNVFVFLTIFRTFKVPLQLQHRVLFWGVIGAIVLRAIFIALGVALLEKFHWIFYIFGVFLIVTGVKIALQREHQLDVLENPFIRFCQRHLRVTKDYVGQHFFTLQEGKRYATPLFIVLLAIEFSDVIFAVDSIPAIFAITTDPFIVYTSNVFAILGLRSLYFVLANAAIRFIYLSYGLAFVLCFVGVKMLVQDFVKVPGLLSLSVIIGGILAAILASIYWERRVRVPQLGSKPMPKKKSKS